MATITICLFEACIHNEARKCTAAAIEISEFLHCSSWSIKTK